MTITETCGCGASFTVTEKFAPHAMGAVRDWREMHKHDRGDRLDPCEEIAENDPRECGFMGCGHPKCADVCAGLPLEEWRTWRAVAVEHPAPPGPPGPPTHTHDDGTRCMWVTTRSGIDRWRQTGSAGLDQGPCPGFPREPEPEENRP